MRYNILSTLIGNNIQTNCSDSDDNDFSVQKN